MRLRPEKEDLYSTSSIRLARANRSVRIRASSSPYVLGKAARFWGLRVAPSTCVRHWPSYRGAIGERTGSLRRAATVAAAAPQFSRRSVRQPFVSTAARATTFPVSSRYLATTFQREGARRSSAGLRRRRYAGSLYVPSEAFYKVESLGERGP